MTKAVLKGFIIITIIVIFGGTEVVYLFLSLCLSVGNTTCKKN